MEETRKQKMKRLRRAFNDTCLERDGEKCVICGKPAVDVHHITDRHEMPNDGYAKENGISLCAECHLNAESFHNTDKKSYIASPRHLYKLIGSSKEKAEAACKNLG